MATAFSASHVAHHIPSPTRLPSYFNCYGVDDGVLVVGIVISPTKHSGRHDSSVIRLGIVLCPCNSDQRISRSTQRFVLCARSHHADRLTDSRLHCTQVRQASLAAFDSSSNSANHSRVHINGGRQWAPKCSATNFLCFLVSARTQVRRN